MYFYDYLTPNVAIASVGWFLLAKRTFNSKPLLDIERDFTAASFGIYFAHVLVMDWWGKCGSCTAWRIQSISPPCWRH